MATLRRRYTGNPETTFDTDIRQIETRGMAAYAAMLIDNELSESFWAGMLPQLMETSSTNRGFLSRDITVHDLLTYRSDRHHVFPRNYLKTTMRLPAGRYNQIANLVIAQSEINIAIGDDPPAKYFPDVAAQCNGGEKKYGGITDAEHLRKNLSDHCLPVSLLGGVIPGGEGTEGEHDPAACGHWDQEHTVGSRRPYGRHTCDRSCDSGYKSGAPVYLPL